MYGMVLMAAVTGSADVTAIGHRDGGGCTGVVAGCNGFGGGCNGKHGGGGLFHKDRGGCDGGGHHRDRGGCNGGGHHRDRNGCHGGGGCHGAVVATPCGCSGIAYAQPIRLRLPCRFHNRSDAGSSARSGPGRRAPGHQRRLRASPPPAASPLRACARPPPWRPRLLRLTNADRLLSNGGRKAAFISGPSCEFPA